MNRKLHHTILAFSLAGLAALAGLLALRPAPPAADPAAAARSAPVPPTTEAAIDAQAERLERALAEATSPAETASVIGGFVAAAAALGALAALEGEDAPPPPDGARPGETDAEPARRARAKRRAIAMPYFSFSHGARQGRS
ncbi:hypothetical protein [Luteimonas huabeiensis]|uniref:hypothetical protein n=1 Tax=Luteimonas huabeiensis TaxID=1244513 RepID=UPI000463D002|nr:hypothetical protein [Luteimonas huabeiensis]